MTISDNGSGLDPDNIVGLALQKGLISEADKDSMDDTQKLDLIFQHGFSSRSSVGYFSGRGVGMDVVKTSIDQVGGNIQISNRMGEGVSFQLSIPKKAISH